jgi:hypothetical protein
MSKLFEQALADLRPEEASFILERLPALKTPEPDAAGPDAASGDEAENRRRRSIPREWPEAGTVLRAEYCGVSYTAEIIPAAKKLKSGKQIRITGGPAMAMVADSFSEAMLLATEEQRSRQNLGRKGVSNGWVFWDWEGKPADIAGDGEAEDEEE